jgi:hypothetical protein
MGGRGKAVMDDKTALTPTIKAGSAPCARADSFKRTTECRIFSVSSKLSKGP